MRHALLALLCGSALCFSQALRADEDVYAGMKSCDAAVAIEAAESLLGDPASLKEPLDLFTPAAVLFIHGRKDDAVFWFYAAQLRSRYQLVFETGNRPELLAAMLRSTGPAINNYAYQDVDKLIRTLDRVFAWDEVTPNPLRYKNVSAESAEAVDQVYEGFRALQAKLGVQKDEVERLAREAAPTIEQAYAEAKAKRCPLSEEFSLNSGEDAP